ncbi:hypothetical protein PG999_007594 [Apiospora kogelbergensis]|uniref:Rhodanese domain-containing protein n=1 Tax=Apiospora kogelbergensis TaxID=1337665 RepID=A0AAW0QMP0_9PEZI
MDVIGKVQASIAAASQETTFALANANFDMSLIRIEAPQEYKALGSSLAKRKRNIAEDGPAHVTARRLGSLFQSILPNTPNLIRAYGTRASEIAQSPVVNPQGTDAHGPFKDYVGVDGTSIWAAATSGSAAIAAHLLACIIATCWPADEATAIWAELVAERKHRIQLKAAVSEYFDLSEVLSSKLELNQTQLACWDASARSWLRAANDSPVVSERQKTARSILDHMNTSVRNQQDLYTSVTEAWKLSLETMEKIITGSSYSIEDGSFVISLLSWHLYPDLIVLGSRARDIIQSDQLVEPGGCVTVGLKSHSVSLDKRTGVRWSLSLAHLRYYGITRPTSRHLANTPSGNERFTQEEFTLIFLGVIIARWRDEEAVSVDDAISFIRVFISTFTKLFQIEHPEQLGSWKTELVAAMDKYTAADSHVRVLARKFVNIGLRNQSIFKHSPENPALHSTKPAKNRTNFSLLGLNSLGFAKVLLDKEDQERFLVASMKRLTRKSAEGSHPVRKLLILMERETTNNFGRLLIFTKSPLKDLGTSHSSPNPVRKSEDGSHYIAHVKEPFTHQKYEESYLWSSPPTSVQRYLKRHYPRRDTTSEANKSFRFCQVVTTTYFVVLETPHEQEMWEPLDSTMLQLRQEIQDCLRHAKLAKYDLLHLVSDQPISKALILLSATCDFYANLAGSAISPNILSCRLEPLANHLYQRHGRPQVIWSSSRPMLTSKHVESLLNERILSHKSSSHTAFMLLVTYEAGIDVPATLSSASASFNWQQLIAVSTEDSIYINPITLGNVTSYTTSSLELRRVRGNVGRPGMSLIGWFAPATRTEWRQPRMDMWHVVNHNPYQGKLEDAFGATSLHLNVTGWAREIDFGDNKCVADGAFLEAVVSAHDTGTWLGDLSFSFLDNPNFRIIYAKKDCRRDTPVIGTMPPEDLVLVENWEELLNPHPVQPAVVMCHGNWQARIAVVSFCLKKGYRTLLFDGHGCWQCAFSHLEELKLKEPQVRSVHISLGTDQSAGLGIDDDKSSRGYSEESEEKIGKTPGSRPNSATPHKESQKKIGKGRRRGDIGSPDNDGNDIVDGIAIRTTNAADQVFNSDIPSTSDDDSEYDTESNGEQEWDEKLKKELTKLPYVTTVFIL